MNVHRLILALILCPVLSLFAAVPGPYFVSNGGDDTKDGKSLATAFKTLEKARNVVRPFLATMDANIIVNVSSQGGVFYQTAPVTFTTVDSGRNGFKVIYQAYTPPATGIAETPVFSGGKVISDKTLAGWTGPFTLNGVTGVYSKNISALELAPFRQLYVNGRRAIRSRKPNVGSYSRLKSWNTIGPPRTDGSPDKTISVKTPDVVGVNTGVGVEIEMVIARLWSQNRLRVKTVTHTGTGTSWVGFKATGAPETPESVIAFKYAVPTLRPDGTWGGGTTKSDGIFYFENSLGFLDSEDEWFLSPAGVLYYKPVLGTSIGSATITAPQLDTLIKLDGTASAHIHDIHFIGLTFSHTAWNLPSSEGYVETQAGISRNLDLPNTAKMTSGVYANFADRLIFEKNTFEHMGGQAITLHSGCQYSVIRYCKVRNISGNGISVDQALIPNDTITERFCTDNVIQNNFVSDCATEYWGSVGIFGGLTARTNVSFNEVAYLPYSGISFGWNWKNLETQASGNWIHNNHVHHVVQLLEDGAAGIYVNGRQGGPATFMTPAISTVIEHNYLHDIRRSRWTADDHGIGAIHLDDGSSYITVRDNVILPSERRVSENFGTGEPNRIHIGNSIAGNESLIPGVVGSAGPVLDAGYLPSPPLRPELVAYWNMEAASTVTGSGGIRDSSRHANNGTFSGALPTALGIGICGGAISFNGTTKITVPDSPSLRLKRFTLCAWIKPSAPWTTAPPTTTAPILISKQGTTSGYLLGSLAPNTNLLGIRFRSTASTSQLTYPETSQPGNWIHVAGTYDGYNLRIYRNGLLEYVSAPVNLEISHNTTPVRIGEGFKGLMDEVRIYNEALTQPDLQTLVDMKFEPDLVARWPMNSGAPGILSDVSGNQNHGVLNPDTTEWAEDQDGQPCLLFKKFGTVAQPTPVRVFHSSTLNQAQYTISVMIQPDDFPLPPPSTANDQSFKAMEAGAVLLVGKQDGAAQKGYFLGRQTASGILPPKLSNRIRGSGAMKETAYEESTTGGPNSPLIHIVGTYDGVTLRIYRDGVLQSAVSSGGLAIEHTTESLLIGYGYEGIMRDVRIYKRALSAAEVNLLGR